MKHIFFKSATCVPCKMVTPLVEQIKNEHSLDIEVVYIDEDEGLEKARSMFVMGVPTIVKIEDSKEKARVNGYKTKPELEKFLLS